MNSKRKAPEVLDLRTLGVSEAIINLPGGKSKRVKIKRGGIETSGLDIDVIESVERFLGLRK